MTPTLMGRLQTRVAVTVVIGGLWSALLAPLLTASVRELMIVLSTMGALGLLWDVLYHWLMGFRWEKDWPSLLGLLTGVNEGVVLALVLNTGAVPGLEVGPSLTTFLVHFVTVWLVTWAWLQGPMKVLDPRWRFRGGRLL